MNSTAQWKCFGCGCDDLKPCALGLLLGCYWVSKNLCSRCVLNGVKVQAPPRGKHSPGYRHKQRRRRAHRGHKK